MDNTRSRTFDHTLSHSDTVCIWMCGPLSLEWKESQTGHRTSLLDQATGMKDTAMAVSLLKLLLCQPHRRAHRDWIMEQFWPESGQSTATHRLETIFSTLRRLLRRPSNGESLLSSFRSGKESGMVYQLAPYPHIWVDADAAEWNSEQAARMERFGENPLLFWEEAYNYLNRGSFLLEEPYADWAALRRQKLEAQYRDCVHALSRLYLAHYGEAGHAQAIQVLRTYWLQHPTDEDALRPLLEWLGQQERYQEAEECYQQLVSALKQDLLDGEEARQPDARTQDLREFLRTKQLQRKRKKKTQEDATTVSSPSLPWWFARRLSSVGWLTGSTI